MEPINHAETRDCLRAEREFLRLLDGDCNQPVGVLAEANENRLTVRGQVFQLEAVTPREGMVEGAMEDAEKLAEELWKKIGVNGNGEME